MPSSTDVDAAATTCSDAKVAHEPLFGSPADHLLWNGLSYLNEQLDRCDWLQVRKPASDEGNRRGDRWRNQWQRDLICNLLPRRHEVVTSVLVGMAPRSSAPGQPDVVTIHPKILITAESRNDNAQSPHTQERTHIAASSRLSNLETSQGVLSAVLRAYREFGGEIPFSTHVGWLSGLFSDCHAEGLTDTQYLKTTWTLGRYVYLVSHPKMLARFNMGTGVGKGNFIDIMTAGIHHFDPGSFETPAGECFSDTPPNLGQAKFIKTIYADVAAHDGGVWVTPGTSFAARCRAPLYDLEGRKFFHGMLSVILKRISVALDTLSATLRNDHAWQTPLTSEYIREVHAKILEVRSAVRSLHRFLSVFGGGPSDSHRIGVLSRHLLWLSRQAGVESPTDAPFKKGATGCDTADHAKRGPECGTKVYTDREADAMEELQHLTASLEGDLVWMQNWRRWAVAGYKYLELLCLHEESIEAACPANRTPRSKGRSEQIRNADLKVMNVDLGNMSLQRLDARACLDAVIQTHGACGIGLEREVLVDHLTKDLQASIREKHRKDSASNGPGSANEMEDPASALQGATEANTKTLADSIHKVQDAWLDKTDFNGTVHSPALILSMMLLAKSPQKLTATTTNDWLKSHGIFGLTPTILRLTDKPRHIIDEAQRCCPSCANLVRCMFRKGFFTCKIRTKVLYHDYQHRWKATALPPFIPKEYVNLCIEAATEQALGKLRGVQHISNVLANMERERLADENMQDRYALLKSDYSPDSPPGAAEDDWALSDDADADADVDRDLEIELMASEMFGGPS
ncbi:unnamed protein product [Zymoseptoria tritici ST99CH_1E4]|nr:unnamed protein product [Zymoseptoria tritici ST99CH_1E4]